MELLERIVDQIAALPSWAAVIAIVLATFVSEDLTCIAAGLLAAGGEIGVGTAIVASGLGIFIGDLGLYWAGKAIGRPALRRRPLRWVLTDRDVERTSEWFAHRGPIVILLGRFVPGSRLPSYFAAGVLGLGIGRFSIYALIAVVLWAPLLVGGALLLGRGILSYYETYQEVALEIGLATLLGFWLLIKLVLPLFSWRGRRLLVSRWRRTVRWEFWPPWVFYAPVAVWVAWLALRHRGLTVFTAANPGVEAGGFVGESKAAILEALGEDSEHVAASRLVTASLPPEQRLESLLEFMEQRGLDWPVVLKPDAGQRGSGVAVVRDEEQAAAYLESTGVDTLAQEHVRGREFGVFWIRVPAEHPPDPPGRIFSITEKRLPELVGDGERTLERLILSDERAVCMAQLYLERNVHDLWRVPARGERVRLVEIGNHCRGAIFLDGAHLRSEAMEAAFTRISDHFEGFWFGRYDICTPSVEAFRKGREFKIIELNGATSEATHVYDPAHGLLQAWRTLFEQWRLLFEIGARNRRRGAETVRLGDLVHRLGEYRVQARSHPAGPVEPVRDDAGEGGADRESRKDRNRPAAVP